jgi:hypothetical protein
MDHVAQADFELAQDAHVEGLGEHFAHQHHLAVQPAVFDDEFADVLEDQLEHALEGFAHGVLVFGGPVEPGAQRLEALEKFGGEGGGVLRTASASAWASSAMPGSRLRAWVAMPSSSRPAVRRRAGSRRGRRWPLPGGAGKWLAPPAGGRRRCGTSCATCR